jgi:hypothetical protein
VDESQATDMVLSGYVGGDSKVNDPLQCELKGSHTRAKIRILPEISWPSGVDLLTSPCAAHQAAWEYLYGRGIGEDIVRQYKLGYGRSGRLKGFVIFPVYMDHHMVYYQGRATWNPPSHLASEEAKKWKERTDYRKTLNPFNDGQSAMGSEVLFNYQRASIEETVVICEGPIDAVKVGVNAVALFGKKGQPAKVERLSRMAARNYVIYLDRGEEEQKAAQELASQLAPYGKVYLATPPVGYDAGALSPEQNAVVISQSALFNAQHVKVNL